MDTQSNRYRGKRFVSLLFVVTLLAAGFFLGPETTFGSYSTALGALYAAYLAGQSATDYQKTKNGVGHD